MFNTMLFSFSVLATVWCTCTLIRALKYTHTQPFIYSLAIEWKQLNGKLRYLRLISISHFIIPTLTHIRKNINEEASHDEILWNRQCDAYTPCATIIAMVIAIEGVWMETASVPHPQRRAKIGCFMDSWMENIRSKWSEDSRWLCCLKIRVGSDDATT